MTTSGDMLAMMIESSEGLLLRFVDGFDESSRTRQAPGLPNHVSWALGHCALTMHRCAELVAGGDGSGPLPASDFVVGDGRGGGAELYDTESVCFGSAPVDEPGLYPSLERGVAVYRGGIARLAGAARSLDEAALAAAVPWGSSSLAASVLIGRVVFHNGTHAGQIADLRRSLGMARVVG